MSLIAEYSKFKQDYVAVKTLSRAHILSSSETSTNINDQNGIKGEKCSSSETLYIENTSSFIPAPPIPPPAAVVSNSTNSNAALKYSNNNSQKEKKFIQQIKVMGIRATREKVLIESFTNTTADYRKHIGELSTSLEQWMAYTKNLQDSSSTALRELELKLDNEIDDKKKMEDALERMKESNMKAKTKMKRLQQELEESMEENDNLEKKYEKQMEQFLDQIEQQVEAFRGEMKANIEETKIVIEAEFEQKFQDRILLLEKEKEEFGKNAEVLRNRHNQELERYEFQLKKKDAVIEESIKEKQSLESKLCRLEDEIKRINSEHQDELSNIQNKLEQGERDREEELLQIERKVKNIVNSKDRQLQMALNNLSEAEEKARAFEACIMKLESGFQDGD